MKEPELRQMRARLDDALKVFRSTEERLTSTELRLQRRLQLLYEELTEDIETIERNKPSSGEPKGYV